MSEPALAKLLNAVEVKGEEILELFSQAEAYLATGEEPDYVKLVGNTYVGELNRGCAVYFRINALVNFLSSEHAKGWLIAELPNGHLYPRRGVIEASAREPLVESKTDWPAFDHAHFQESLLGSAEPDGRA